MVDKAAEKLNVEVGAGGGALNKIIKDFEIGKSKLSDKEIQEAVIKANELTKLEKNFETKKTQNVVHEATHVQTPGEETPLTFEQKQNMVTGFLKKNNIDPTKYPDQINSLVNRVGTPDESTIMEIIARSNTIAKLSEEKGTRGKIFSFFGFQGDKIA